MEEDTAAAAPAAGMRPPSAASSALLAALFRQAKRTFAPPPSPRIGDFALDLADLRRILDRVRAEHVRLDPSFGERALWEGRSKAPCTYIEIFQNQHLNVSIFVLKPGFTMPLHDHPHMHGLLKVIAGRVRIRCFTRVPSRGGDEDGERPPRKDDDGGREAFDAVVSEHKVCDAESETCVLTPDESNYHEIEAVDGAPAAFLDVLAPPYSTYVKGGVGEQRQCRYYEILEELGPDLVRLREVPLPAWFYCDQAPYLGPGLM